MDPRAEAVLEFWFGGTRDDPQQIRDRMAFWFGGGDRADLESMDREIAQRFGALVGDASRGDLDDWSRTAHERLALILLLDQFRRNIHRGSPQAFSCDARTLELTLDGLDQGMHRMLSAIERVFFMMPLQHSEQLEAQERSVREFEALRAALPAHLESLFRGFADYAVVHRDIVARFGRFPHRNAILGRTSTQEESDYLADDAPTFGQ
jgi:uncharacterized protein (DUF924 family)